MKIAPAVVSAVLAMALSGCGDSISSTDDTLDNSSAKEQEVSSEEQSASTERYETEFIAADVREGWLAADVPDMIDKYDGDTDPNAVYIIKNGVSADDMMRKPYLWITYYDSKDKWSPSKSFYDDAEDIDPVNTGTREWSGYSFTSYDIPGVTVSCPEGDGLWVCSAVLENGGLKISLDDSDVREMLESLKVK